MSETHKIERSGLAALQAHLLAAGRTTAPSPTKKFDLMIDGVPAEVKCKQLPWARVDFIGLTDNQHDALRNGERFILFVVCNLAGDGPPEIVEIPSEGLADATFRVESTHYLYGSQLRDLSNRRGT